MQRDQIGCVSLSAGFFERPAACSRIYSRIKGFEAVALQDAYSIAKRRNATEINQWGSYCAIIPSRIYLCRHILSIPGNVMQGHAGQVSG